MTSELTEVSLTRGQVHAVRAAFQAGVTPSRTFPDAIAYGWHDVGGNYFTCDISFAQDDSGVDDGAEDSAAAWVAIP